MKRSTTLAVGLWVLIVGGNILQAQLLPSRIFMEGPRLPWPIVLMPLIIVVGAFLRRGHPGEAVLGSWVDRRFGPGAYKDFMDALRVELLLAAMCLGIVLSAIARAVLFKTTVLPPTIMGFFISGAVAFVVAYCVRRARGNLAPATPSPGKPTLLQRYYLMQIAGLRWFGAVFAGIAILITASNLPWLVHSRTLGSIATNLAAGVGFFLVGLAMYLIGAAVQRRYRAHIARQGD